MKSFILFVLLVISQTLSAQQSISIKDATGKYILSDDITPSQAKNLAIEEAKKDALRKAGVVENISESNMLYSLSQEKDFKQFFNSISTIEINGAIKETKNIRISEGKDNVTNQTYYEVFLDAEVIKYTKRTDASFNFDVQGILDKYDENGHINFSIKPSTDGYLKIFVIKDKTVDLLFPNKYERDSLLTKENLIYFPTNKAIEYGFDNIVQNESQLILIVFTKKNIPFYKEVSYDNVMNWVYEISPDERRVRSFQLIVTK